MEVKNTYLFRLASEFKLLFTVAVVWLLGTMWFALKSHEEFPFLLFGMYSLKEKSKAEYTAYSIVVNGKEIVYNDLRDAQRELVLGSLSHQTNPLADAAFMNWMRAYTANGGPLEIYKLTCLYSQEGKPLIRKRDLIYPHDEF